MKWSIEQKIRVGFGLALAVLLVIGAVSYRNAIRFVETLRWEEHTERVLDHLRLTLVSLLNAETASRGYALTGNELFLEPYQPGITGANESVKELQKSMADNPGQLSKLDVLESLVARKMRFMAELIETRKTQGADAADQKFSTREGKQVMNEIRKVIGEMEAVEKRLLQAHSASAQLNANFTRAIAIFGSLVGIVFVGIASIIVHHDFQKRRPAEEERDRFFTLSLDMLCIAGFDGYFKRLNPAWEKVLGFTQEELLAQPYLDFIHPDDRPATIAEAQKIAAGASVISFENRYRCKDGSYRWFLWSATPVIEQQLIYATVRDITERKQAEEARLLLAAIIESTEDAIISKYLDGTITSWNPGAERLFGYTAAEVLGKSVLLLIPPDRPDEEPELLARLKLGQRVEDIETVRIGKDGRRIHVSATISPIKDQAGRVIGVSKILRDVTERRLKDEQICQLHADLRCHATQLEGANKELEAFSYSVSHDLRAPLRHMAGYLQLLQKHAGSTLDAKGRRYLEMISESVKEMGGLIDDLLSFSRMGRTEMRATRVNVEQLIKDSINDMGQETEGRDIVWKIAALPEVQADPSLMRQVMVNLVSNALKYSRTRARTQIEIGCQPDPNGDHVFYVRDNGVGFDMQFADKLFGVFQRLHDTDEFEGTGIGLANVQRIISRHGGRTWAEGKVGEGAAVYFSLPRLASEQSPSSQTTDGCNPKPEAKAAITAD